MAKNWLKWIASIAVLTLGISLIAAVATSPARGTTFLEAMKILVSWPFAVCSLGFAFGIAFKPEIRAFIVNIAEIWLPGGSRITTRQQPTPENNTGNEITGPKDLSALPAQKTVEEYERLLQDARIGIAYWRFQFLNWFLVPRTKEVLKWIGQTGGVTVGAYREFWRKVFVSEAESEITSSVLLQNWLITLDSGLYKITPIGRDFLGFLEGRFPPPSLLSGAKPEKVRS